MQLNSEIKKYIDNSVLCWLATSSDQNMPNVSPKEIFTHFGDASVIIANIASPQSVRNITANPNVCVSFVDVLVQKGYQLKGDAAILNASLEENNEMEKKLSEMTGGKFPFSSIIHITITTAKPILAPSYLLFPETTEEDQIASAIQRYGLEKQDHHT